jgi:nucleoside-diphosphate-sugar epimerase
MQKIVVTGGAGFIGSHIANALAENGFEVHAIDDLSSGSKENLQDGINLHVVDIRRQDQVQKIIQGSDFVFHLAALPSVPLSIEDPLKTNDVNVNGTISVLEAAKKVKVKRLIYAGSCAVYGMQKSSPLKEDMQSNPMSPYALQKLMGEYYCKLFAKLYGLETVVLRYFNAYGKNMPENGAYTAAIKHWLSQKESGKALTVFGGKQTRDFTHISDIVRASILAMESKKVGKGEAINIGSGKSVVIEELAKKISDNIDYQKPREGDIQDSLADIKKAKKLLNWEPQISLKEGIAQLMK